MYEQYIFTLHVYYSITFNNNTKQDSLKWPSGS